MSANFASCEVVDDAPEDLDDCKASVSDAQSRNRIDLFNVF